MAGRVWDPYLTEQDRAHLGSREPRRKGFGEKPALLLIDYYRWAFGDKPEPLLEAVKTWPGSCGLAGWNAIPPTQRLLEAARSAGIPVIFSTGPDETALVAWGRGGRRAEDEQHMSPDELDRSRRGYDIIDEVKPLPGEAIIRKMAPSVFWGTPLIGHLIALGVDTILVGGESTSGCVRATVVEGNTYRYKMVLAEECVFDRHEATHAMNLFDMNQKYADVLPLEEVLDYVRSRRAAGSLVHA